MTVSVGTCEGWLDGCADTDGRRDGCELGLVDKLGIDEGCVDGLVLGCDDG